MAGCDDSEPSYVNTNVAECIVKHNISSAQCAECAVRSRAVRSAQCAVRSAQSRSAQSRSAQCAVRSPTALNHHMLTHMLPNSL